jgi:hypothetical protein
MREAGLSFNPFLTWLPPPHALLDVLYTQRALQEASSLWLW